MKQKYVMPTIEIVGSFLENSILVASQGDSIWGAGGDGGPGTGGGIGGGNSGGSGSGSGSGKPPYPGGSSSKEHNFNVWESWDEY